VELGFRPSLTFVQVQAAPLPLRLSGLTLKLHAIENDQQ
jgi:hypothetical protein